MNRTKAPILFAVFILVILLLNGCSLPIPETDFSLRPLEIVIVDAESKEPLEGIHVYHLLNSDIYGGCWEMFMRMCPSDSNYWVRESVSDEDGVVKFDRQIYDLTCDEFLQAEILAINLELRPEVYEKSDFDKAETLYYDGVTPYHNEGPAKNLFAIDAIHKGKIILGTAYSYDGEPFDSEQDPWHGYYDFFDVERNLEGFTKNHQTLIVELPKISTK
jgi:hypothetical protein